MLVPFIRRAEETNQYTNEYRWKVQQTTYFESIGWWAGDPANIPVHPDKRRWFIPEILSCSELRLLEINDHSAVISVAGVTRIHVDLQHGFIRLRQDEANLEGGAVTGKISGITLSDFRKADGIYLPFRIERLGDDGRLHTIHAVKSCSINCVPESRFVLEYKPGTFVIDRDSDNRTFSAGGVDCLERILLHQSKHLPTQEHLLIDRFVQWSFGIMLGFVVTGVIGKK